MKRLVNIKTLDRRLNYLRFINYSNPIGVITSTVNIKKLVKIHKRKGYKLNAMVCYCILKAARPIKELHYEIIKKKLYYFDEITVAGITLDKKKNLYSTEWEYYPTFKAFYKNYLNACDEVLKNPQGAWDTKKTKAKICTSCVPNVEMNEGVLPLGSELSFAMLFWGKCHKDGSLPISFRFHHSIMDGGHIAQFFINLQKEINKFKKRI